MGPLILLYNTTLIGVIVYATDGIFVLMATMITIFSIAAHLRHFVQKRAQTYIIRILLMVPIYAIDSLLSLLFVDKSVYFDLARDCYEAFVLYEFFSLLEHYFIISAPAYFKGVEDGLIHIPEDGISTRLISGTNPLDIIDEEDSDPSIEIGSKSEEDDEEEEPQSIPIDDALIIKEEEEDDAHQSYISFYLSKFGVVSYPFPCCCLPYALTDSTFYIRIRRLVFQYVVIKPILSLTAIILHALNLYHPGSFSPFHGYLWITLVMNVSVGVSLYALVLFCRLIEPAITKHYPMHKLIAIKAILFFIFWQSVLFSLIGYIPGLLAYLYTDTLWHGEALVAVLNNSLICFEMVILSIVNIYVFPYDGYKQEEAEEMQESGIIPMNESKMKKYKRFGSQVLNPKDVLKDSKNIVLGREADRH